MLRNEIQRYRDELGLEVTAAFEHEFNLGYKAPDNAHHAFSLSAQHHAASFGGWLLSALLTSASVGNERPRVTPIRSVVTIVVIAVGWIRLTGATPANG